MATVSLKNVKKIYDNKVTAVHDFNLEIADKEFIVLVGPSGCGKSTTLRMIAGLEDISEGDLVIGGKRMNDVEPKDRDIAMVFQSYALYPHMTVYENMAFALKLRKVPKEEIDKKVREAAEILDITQYLDRKPKALSGGQRQRVAIGRAIVRDPQVFLMDEPLSNLDAKLRNQMRAEIIKLRQRINTTFIYVTHDQTEAMTLGDRIVIMKDGFIQQIGTPQEVFDQPANLFVAGFIGSPQMNFFDGELVKEGETSPPKRYTSGSMILAMENAGQLIEDEDLRAQIKGSGIGTSATRAEILKKLVNIKYLGLNKKTQVITPTLLGEMVFDVVSVSISQLLNPELTASWEKGLTYVAEGSITSDEYMEKLERFVAGRTYAVLRNNHHENLRQYFERAALNYKGGAKSS